MENFNGLQEWNARADSMKELIKLAVGLEDPVGVIQQLRKECWDYLQVPYVNVKCSKPDKKARLHSQLLLRLCDLTLTNAWLTKSNRSDTSSTIEIHDIVFFYFVFVFLNNVTHMFFSFFIFHFGKKVSTAKILMTMTTASKSW
jgi:hypothetical protein